MESIAVIGMSGRFPGARTVEEFWRNLQAGLESIRRFSEEELLASGMSREMLSDPAYVRARSMLEDVEMFDADFFGYHPREAANIDPQHRLFLVCSHEALESAGYDPFRYPGAIGVYAGTSLNTYLLENLCRDRSFIEALTGAYQVGSYDIVVGNDKDYLVTRVSHRLNLRGPSMLIQSACSTSLVAVAQACQALLAWQCDMALAGGASISVPQRRGYLYEEGGIVSSDGCCRPFDAESSGTVFGAGVGVVVLKRLSDALADGDTIHAVIRGFAVNNDGADKLSFMAPTIEGQAEVIALAQALAGVDPSTIGYVEAHGTGTPIGDPIEVAALTRAFRVGTDATGFCALGSVKSNVGHLEVAAGVTGLIKTVLMLADRKMVPTLHFTRPNPRIDFASSPFYVNRELRDWPAGDTPRRAGVTSLGVGGTNAHVVLEEAPRLSPPAPSRPLHLLVLSARTPGALEASCSRLSAHLEAHPEQSLADVAYTLQVGRRLLPHRRAVVCADSASAAAALRERVRPSPSADTDPPIAFMFPGQGAQHVGMGAALYEAETVFRDAVDACCNILEPHLGLDLRTLLYADPAHAADADARLKETFVTQPALFVTEYALARLWMSWGIRPTAMIGHSVGEYVAACLSEVFSLEDALTLLAARARLMQDLPGGSMLAVRAGEDDVSPLLDGRLSLAAINGPKACVISGPTEHVADFKAEMERLGTLCRLLHTSHAFHSRMMDPLAEPFTALAARTRRGTPRIPYVSNVTAAWITEEDLDDPGYWFQHLRGAVRFSAGLGLLLGDPRRLLLEVGPGQTLTALARQQVQPATQRVVASLPGPAEGGSDLSGALRALGSVWTAGGTVDWEAFNGPGRRRVPLPTYPFEEQRCWVDAPPRGARGGEPASFSSALAFASAFEDVVPDPSRTVDATPAPLVEELQDALAELSGVPRERLDPRATFLEMGFDSLFLTQVAQSFRVRFGVRVTLRQLLQDVCTLEAVAARIEAHRAVDRPQDAAPTARSLEDGGNDENRAKGAAVLQGTGIPKARRLPLTESQREIWLVTQMGPHARRAYNESCSLRLRGRLHVQDLEAAIQGAVNAHEALRATFSADGEYVEVAEKLGIDVPLVDLSGQSEDERQMRMAALLDEEARFEFDVVRGPLIRIRLVRLASEDHLLVVTAHHISCDGHSFDVLFTDVGSRYTALREGAPAPARPPMQLSEYVSWEGSDASAARHAEDEAWWLEQLSRTLPEPLDLPTDRPRPALKTYHGARLGAVLEADLVAGLKRVAGQQGCTQFALLMAAFHAWLFRLSGQDDVVVGFPVAGQMLAGGEDLVGHCVHMLPLRSRPSGDEPFSAFLARVNRSVLDACDHPMVTFGTLVRRLNIPRDPSRVPLVSVTFNVDPPMSRLRFADLAHATSLNPRAFYNFDFGLNLTEEDGRLLVECDHNTDLFDAPTISRLLDSFRALLEGVAADPGRALKHLPLLTEAQRQQVLVDFNPVPMSFETLPLLHQLVEAQAERTPDAVALDFEGRLLTYRELNARANRLVHRLRRRGVVRGTRVGLHVHRSLEQIVAILAILKAGGAYVPLDRSLPAERIAFMLEDAAVSVVVTGHPAECPAGAVAVAPDDSDGPSANPAPVNSPEDIAYVIYTSGSTGRPKGVLTPHRAVVSYLEAMRREAWLGPSDVLVAVASLSFDFHVAEILIPLTTGARVVLVDRTVAADGGRLRREVERSQATALAATPATFRLLFEAGWKGDPGMTVHVGGEVFPSDLASRLLGCVRSLYNVYGPTETTVYATTHRVTSAEGPLPIGRPLANTRIYVLDAFGEPVPAGVPGELFIGGSGVAYGYLNRPDLTAEKFVEDRFVDPGQRLYRTGDRGRWLADGVLEILGRTDQQVKIRGYRIETGEIEAALGEMSEVRQATVVAREDTPGDLRLVAYVVTEDGKPLPPAGWMRDRLARFLPQPMIPAAFVRLEALPLNANGKIDRRSLPPPQEEDHRNGDFAPPLTPLEQTVADIWSQVLDVRPVGRYDDFFTQGGHSMLAVRLFGRLEQVFGRNLPLSTLFSAPTVEQLARVLETAEPGAAPRSALIPIRSQGTATPFIWLHTLGGGGGGGLLRYRALAERLGVHRPSYGIEAPREPFARMEDMAEHYIEVLRGLQPHGPYYLGGYCFGGVVAFEMARQLELLGEPVALVVIIEADAPVLDSADNRGGMAEVARRLRNFLDLAPRQRLSVLRRTLRRIGRLLTGRERSKPLLEDWVDMSQYPADYKHFALTHWDALMNYRPAPYGGRVVLYRVIGGPTPSTNDPTLGWRALATGGVDVRFVPGAHDTVVEEPYVDALAADLRGCLEKVEAPSEREAIEALQRAS